MSRLEWFAALVGIGIAAALGGSLVFAFIAQDKRIAEKDAEREAWWQAPARVVRGEGKHVFTITAEATRGEKKQFVRFNQPAACEALRKELDELRASGLTVEITVIDRDLWGVSEFLVVTNVVNHDRK
jgi:hypothetical protein